MKTMPLPVQQQSHTNLRETDRKRIGVNETLPDRQTFTLYCAVQHTGEDSSLATDSLFPLPYIRSYVDQIKSYPHVDFDCILCVAF